MQTPRPFDCFSGPLGLLMFPIAEKSLGSFDSTVRAIQTVNAHFQFGKCAK